MYDVSKYDCIECATKVMYYKLNRFRHLDQLDQKWISQV